MACPSTDKNDDEVLQKEIYTGNSISCSGSLDNIDSYIENLKKCKILREHDVIWMCSRGKDIFRQEPNIKQVYSPVTVCGDIHGQMYDLKELFIVGGDVPETNYLFMGDYVDRGMYSIETFLLLLALKIRYPSKITLLRGNHECRHVTMVFGFYDECLRKFGSATVWKHCTDLFDTLPIAATVDNQILCVHGGLSPTLNTLDEMKQIDRFTEVPTTGAMCDLLWSDPHDKENGWKRSPRGAGYTFGPDVTKEFIFTNGLNVVCRSHQLVNEGFRWYFGKMLLTVWSAPNYCYRCGNLAAIMELSEHLEQCFITFMAAPTALRGHLARRPPPQYFI